MNKNDTPTNTSAYGRRPMWQWLLIYAIVGGAIYAAIYLFLYHKPASAYKYPAAASTQSQSTANAPMMASPTMAPAGTPAYSQPAMPASNMAQRW